MHTKLYVALQRLELRAMVCGSPPSLSAAAPPSNLASSAWAFDRLNAPRHKPKQSLSNDIDRSERTHHWLQLLQFLEEEHHHRKLAQAFAVRSCVLSYPRWKTCIKLFHWGNDVARKLQNSSTFNAIRAKETAGLHNLQLGNFIRSCEAYPKNVSETEVISNTFFKHANICQWYVSVDQCWSMLTDAATYCDNVHPPRLPWRAAEVLRWRARDQTRSCSSKCLQ